AAVEQAAEHVAQVVDAKARERARGATAASERVAHRTEAARLVVLLTLRLVTEDVERGGDLLEPLLVAAVSIRVVLLRQLAVRGFDLLRRRLVGDTEGLVVILLEP